MVCEEGLKDKQPASFYIGRWGDGSEEYKTEPLYFAPKKRTQLEFEVTEEMARAVQLFLDTVNTELEIWELQGLNPILNVEVGFSLEKVMGRNDMFGTNDASIWVPGYYLGVFDYKHGKGEIVEVEENSQLKYYALGALIELCWDDILGGFDWDRMPERIELVIVQPRAPHANGPVRRWEIDPTALVEDFVAEMKDDVTAIDRLFAMFPNIERISAQEVMDALPMEEFATGDWCKWCKAKAGCKAMQLEAKRAMTKDFSDEGLSVEELGDIVSEETKGMVTKTGKNKGSPSARQITSYIKEKATEMAKANMPTTDPVKLKRLLDAADLIEWFAKAVRQQVYNQVQNGAKIPGYKLVRKSTNRKWKNPEEVKEALSLFFREDEILLPPELKSYTDIEAMNAEAAALVEGLTERPEGGLVIAKETDKREAVTPNASNAFGEDILDPNELE
jgi:hypothetical protein